MNFKTPHFIPFHLGDPAGIAFFGHIIALSHQSIELFIINKGIPWKTWYQNKKFGAPIKNVNADFKRPVLPGRHYDFQVELIKTGSSSLVFKISILDQENDDFVHAEVQITLVFVSAADGKIFPIEIPEDLKSQVSS